MNDRTVNAIQESRQHWLENERAEKVWDVCAKSKSCALCNVFYDKGTCRKCPIAIKFGRCGYTEGNPWRATFNMLYAWRVATSLSEEDQSIARARFCEYAREMRRAIESLLPEEKWDET